MALVYKKIDNPLTIIAIFGSFIEVCATIVLPQLDLVMQEKFIWFVMFFPSLVVLTFFIFLWFKHINLYAPSDFKDEKNFMKSNVKGNKLKSNTENEVILTEPTTSTISFN